MGNDLAVQEQQQENPKTFPGMLVAFKAQIAAALPKHLSADRMTRIALTCFRLNPMLAKCDPASVFACVIQSSQMGLELGLNGRAYLVPYYNTKAGRYECQFIPGWKGLVELANRTGRAWVCTGAVFAGDEFSYQLGDNPQVLHRPGDDDDPDHLLYTYAVGRVRGSEYPIVEVWSQEKLRKHFLRYNKVGDRHYAHENWEMYARKIPLLQVLKYLPSSPELEAAISFSYAADTTAQELQIKDAIDGTFMPPSATAEEPEGNNGGGLKERTRRAPAARKADASNVPPVTYESIASAMDKATNGDEIDLAESLIANGIPDAKQADELRDLARVNRLRLGL